MNEAEKSELDRLVEQELAQRARNAQAAEIKAQQDAEKRRTYTEAATKFRSTWPAHIRAMLSDFNGSLSRIQRSLEVGTIEAARKPVVTVTCQPPSNTPTLSFELADDLTVTAHERHPISNQIIPNAAKFGLNVNFSRDEVEPLIMSLAKRLAARNLTAR